MPGNIIHELSVTASTPATVSAAQPSSHTGATDDDDADDAAALTLVPAAIVSWRAPVAILHSSAALIAKRCAVTSGVAGSRAVSVAAMSEPITAPNVNGAYSGSTKTACVRAVTVMLWYNAVTVAVDACATLDP